MGGKKKTEIIRPEILDGTNSERGGISNMGRKKLAWKRENFSGGEREWPQ